VTNTVTMLRLRPLWRLKPTISLGFTAKLSPAAFISSQQPRYFAQNAAQNGGQGPLDYYFTVKLALKRIFLGQTAGQHRLEEEAQTAATALKDKNQFQDLDPIAQKVAEPNADPLPDPADPGGLDWSDETAYRRTIGPLADANYTGMQQAGNTLGGDLKQPSGPESTVKMNVLKDAMPVTSSTDDSDIREKEEMKQKL
jgi:hypothetical protein